MGAKQFARRWAWVAALVVGSGMYLAVLAVLADTDNPNLVPTMILLGALVVPMTFVIFAAGRAGRWLLDGLTLTGCLLFGGVIGVVVAGFVEYDTMRRLDVMPMAAVGLIEEAAKLIVPVALVVFAHRRYKSVATGVVVGVAVGTGFAILETMGYAFVALIQSGGSIGAAESTLFIRGLLSPAGHAAWTGIACWGLWRFAAQPSAKRFLGFLGMYLFAAVLHTSWDGIGGWVTYAVVGAISVTVLLVAIRRANRLDAALAQIPPTYPFGYSHPWPVALPPPPPNRPIPPP